MLLWITFLVGTFLASEVQHSFVRLASLFALPPCPPATLSRIMADGNCTSMELRRWGANSRSSCLHPRLRLGCSGFCIKGGGAGKHLGIHSSHYSHGNGAASCRGRLRALL